MTIIHLLIFCWAIFATIYAIFFRLNYRDEFEMKMSYRHEYFNLLDEANRMAEKYETEKRQWEEKCSLENEPAPNEPSVNGKSENVKR